MDYSSGTKGQIYTVFVPDFLKWQKHKYCKTYLIIPFLSDPFQIAIVIVLSVGFTLGGCIVGGGGGPK